MVDAVRGKVDWKTAMTCERCGVSNTHVEIVVSVRGQKVLCRNVTSCDRRWIQNRKKEQRGR